MLSGASWVARFPTSDKVADLETDFGAKVSKFLDALTEAGGQVRISATRRPAQRAYLMHYCWAIVHKQFQPEQIPAYQPTPDAAGPVDIEWVHRTATGDPDPTQSLAAALEMVRAYDMSLLKTTPALNSLHISGQAIDMTIRWANSLSIKDAEGKMNVIKSEPRTGINPDLMKLGRSYGVIHMINVDKDEPHWSINGH